MGFSETVDLPAGRYARMALERLDIWELLAERVVAAPDVRVALAYVAQGAVDGAIVYQTDAALSENVAL